MKTRLIAATTAISLLLAGWIWARETVPAFVGTYEDIRYLGEQGRQDGGFTFARLVYNGHIRGYYKNWYTDFPKGDRQLIDILSRLTGVDVAAEERAIPVRHPDLFNYPFVYSVEGGQMSLEWSDARILREYLDRGGFWMIDDFWGQAEWGQFALAIEKVFSRSTDRGYSGDSSDFSFFLRRRRDTASAEHRIRVLSRKLQHRRARRCKAGRPRHL